MYFSNTLENMYYYKFNLMLETQNSKLVISAVYKTN